MGELYFVQRGDTLSKIAKYFAVTVNGILQSNVICNPNLIFTGQPLLIPDPQLELPKAGGIPYYVVLPGDSLWCLSKQFNIPVSALAKNNQISNPNIIFPEQELILVDTIPDPAALKKKWEQTGGPNCEIFGFQSHGLYVDTFAWAALGRRAIPYLLDLLHQHCAEIRYYTIMSLGRIGQDHRVTRALRAMISDPEGIVSSMAELASRRIEIVMGGKKRIHLLITDQTLFSSPRLDSEQTSLPWGTEIIVLRWLIPSPTGEEGPRGGLQLYEYVKVVETGQSGFLPRLGLDEITFI